MAMRRAMKKATKTATKKAMAAMKKATKTKKQAVKPSMRKAVEPKAKKVFKKLSRKDSEAWRVYLPKNVSLTKLDKKPAAARANTKFAKLLARLKARAIERQTARSSAPRKTKRF